LSAHCHTGVAIRRPPRGDVDSALELCFDPTQHTDRMLVPLLLCVGARVRRVRSGSQRRDRLGEFGRLPMLVLVLVIIALRLGRVQL
jgi:hypothetical protein